jgi:hypothetical protein
MSRILLNSLSRSNLAVTKHSASFNQFILNACLATASNQNVKIQDDEDDVIFGTGGKFVELDRARTRNPAMKSRESDFSAKKSAKKQTEVNDPDQFGTLTNELDSM